MILAYTIPLDHVPELGNALMVATVATVTQGTKASAKYLARPTEGTS